VSPLAGLSADRVRKLKDGELACRSCGVGVKRSSSRNVETLDVLSPRAAIVSAIGLPVPTAGMATALCQGCADRIARAERVVDSHGLNFVYGDAATDHVNAALEALDVLRIRGARTDALTTAAGVRDFVDTLAWVGSRATWAARFAPLQLPGADPGTCAVGRWSHVSREDVGLIASEYRTLVHRRMEVPMPYTPPAREGGLRGCLLCGVGSIVTTESLAADAWGSLERVQTGTIGGANRASSARGHLCPNCRAAVEQVGAPGMSAVERALMNHLGFKVRYGSTVNFTDESVVHGWAALPPGTPANDEPWAHLDLPRITRALQVEYHAEPIAESAR